MTRAEARLPLSTGSLLTVAEAVREIGGRDVDVRRWLRDHGLVRDVPGLGTRVVWGRVLAAINGDDDETTPRTMRRVAL